MAKTIVVNVVGDTSKLQSSLGQAESRMDKFGKVAVKGGVALTGLGFAFARLGEEAAEHNKAVGQTDAVLKSTGGAANVTAGQISGMAEKLGKLAVVDDDVIRSGQNLLLTFTNIRNETGKGNDIFDQATLAATDMAAALNGGQVTAEGLKSANIQLGKALNDPIKGITALSRVGVSFTAEQKAQITAMAESGDIMGAQKLILAELTKEFGGSTKATGDNASASQKFSVIMSDLREKIGGVVGGFAPFLQVMGPALAGMGGLAQSGISLGGVFGALGGGVKGLGAIFAGFMAPPGGLILLAIAALAAAAFLVIKNWDKVSGFFSALWGGIRDAFKVGINGVISLLNLFIKAFTAPFALLAKLPGPQQGLLKSISGFQIPKLAHGGIVTSPTLAMLGEGGHDEAVIPLNRAGSLAPTVNVFVTLDGKKVASSIRTELLRSGLRTGTVGLA